MIDDSTVKIEILSEKKVRLHHGWTEMGQGVHNMALQTLCEETGLDPDIIEVVVDTEAQIKTGMTTASRATALVGLAVIETAKGLKKDLETKSLADLTGKIMNPMLFEGQIQGAVHMGLGYALSEDLPMKDGYLVSDRMRDLKILRAYETPDIQVIGVEVRDPVGPYGAKGIGEIGLVPTAGAVANALFAYDSIRRTKLPMKRK